MSSPMALTSWFGNKDGGDGGRRGEPSFILIQQTFVRSLHQVLGSGRLIPPVPFFFPKIALAIRGFLYFHTNCEIICSSSVKNTVGSLIGIALNL